MTEIVKQITVARGKPSDLPDLLAAKGFHNDYDGWRRLPKTLNRLSPTKPWKLELVFFRPTKEEHDNYKNPPEVFAQRGLKAASLWEVLTILPSREDYDARQTFIQELGEKFVMFAHGHWHKTWASGQATYIMSKYGHTLDFGYGLLTNHHWCWYIGFRKIKIIKTQLPE